MARFTVYAYGPAVFPTVPCVQNDHGTVFGLCCGHRYRMYRTQNRAHKKCQSTEEKHHRNIRDFKRQIPFQAASPIDFYALKLPEIPYKK